MKIAIIGTRGIPNHYGGFEQFAEYLSKFLAANGSEVTVYNSHDHPYQETNWNGVNIIHRYDPEKRMGTFGQFLYDLNCILDARKKNYDIILQLGYTSSSVFSKIFPKGSIIITNMDGLEWKRSKYTKNVQKFLKYAESLAAKNSDFLIADSIGIRNYLYDVYKKESKYIPYGANLVRDFDAEYLTPYNLQINDYDLLIARLEPENSIETILDGVVSAETGRMFLVIGNQNTRYGKSLQAKYKRSNKIRFLGTIYNINVLNNLRYYSQIYFHGHTVGGTNPSLLEAMASGALICANNNVFNKSILKDEAYYFSDASDVASVLRRIKKTDMNSQRMISKNYDKIRETFTWEIINEQYMSFFKDCVFESNNLKSAKLGN